MSIASEWRKKRIEDLTLPSGVTIRVARPHLQVWMMSGRLPDSLLALALGRDKASIVPVEQNEAAAIEQVKEAGSFVKTIVLDTVVEPKLIEHGESCPHSSGDENDMCLDDISDEDMAFIFSYAKNNLPQAAVPTKQDSAPGKDGLTADDVASFRAEVERQLNATASVRRS